MNICTFSNSDEDRNSFDSTDNAPSHTSFATDILSCNVLEVLPNAGLPLEYPETPCSEKLSSHSLKLFTLSCLLCKDGSPHYTVGVGRLLPPIFGLLVILHSTRAEYDDYGFESFNILMPSSAQ